MELFLGTHFFAGISGVHVWWDLENLGYDKKFINSKVWNLKTTFSMNNSFITINDNHKWASHPKLR